MGATEKIARFIVDTGYEDIPLDAVEKAKRTALDCVGASLAGVSEPGVQAILEFLSDTVPEAKKATPAQFFDERFVRQLNSTK